LRVTAGRGAASLKVAAEHGAVGCIIYLTRATTATTRRHLSERRVPQRSGGATRIGDGHAIHPGDPLTPASARRRTRNAS
jgi:hypothetical protein